MVWRSRSPDSVYPTVRFDAVHYKVTDDRGCAVSRAIYNVPAMDKEGRKDLLDMYVSKNEGANFRLNVLTDLQGRGVRDILMARVVRQISNSVKHVGSRHQEEFMKDLKRVVHGAVSKEAAETGFLNPDEKWGGKYPVAIITDFV